MRSEGTRGEGTSAIELSELILYIQISLMWTWQVECNGHWRASMRKYFPSLHHELHRTQSALVGVTFLHQCQYWQDCLSWTSFFAHSQNKKRNLSGDQRQKGLVPKNAVSGLFLVTLDLPNDHTNSAWPQGVSSATRESFWIRTDAQTQTLLCLTVLHRRNANSERRIKF